MASRNRVVSLWARMMLWVLQPELERFSQKNLEGFWCVQQEPPLISLKDRVCVGVFGCIFFGEMLSGWWDAAAAASSWSWRKKFSFFLIKRAVIFQDVFSPPFMWCRAPYQGTSVVFFFVLVWMESKEEKKCICSICRHVSSCFNREEKVYLS